MGFTHLQIWRNPWLGDYRPHIPVLSALCHLNLLNPPPKKSSGYATNWALQYGLLPFCLHKRKIGKRGLNLEFLFTHECLCMSYEKKGEFVRSGFKCKRHFNIQLGQHSRAKSCDKSHYNEQLSFQPNLSWNSAFLVIRLKNFQVRG
jgi:hypothetical protein